ncbi:xylose isomerase [Alicyclobacillus acidoterrestris]|uniref:Xylose isomerase n=1 Tax=Alicyclobacillus acidoterrestris (strain ATCC 49025 / DSM 3922 / CIP 106132 / NCIMB 13137 / GD3B) TaxID=1356854 RepID=T0C8A7_ALIAG|nr:xylose isomerase [Alicyclobacillus acidoterrestris]EPZ49169.1 xylose isomerase [Alicyclobacillus acidoterrestris ATCC 49025]UNO50033.1 xylose isomerase [Alicyclobacillus acidoterrestris]
MAYFPEVKRIQYEGRKSTNPLAFKHYNPSEVVLGKTMEEHLRFAVSYWHTFTLSGSDPFGLPNMIRPWDGYSGLDLAKKRVEAAFEFFEKMGVNYFCFHDRDIAPEGDTLRETNKNLDVIVSMIREYMKSSGKKLLWNTQNMFSNPRFAHGAGTSPEADVFAYAAAQVKKGLEVALELGAENYVFWGGREGYETLLNTDMKLELDNQARLFHMACDYADEIGFKGQFLIEPKPKEPTKHQYDFDAASAIAFLKTYDLDKRFKLNLEANHATLAGHTFEHELYVSRIHGMLGSVDANQGDPLLGWDTDEFPTDMYSATLAMYQILKNGGLHSGGLNFDAKVRRASMTPIDLFYGHVVGMDTFARGLKVAAKLVEDKVFDQFIEERYKSYQSGIGQDIVSGKATLKSLEDYIIDKPVTVTTSGRQELLLAKLNQYLLEVE